LDGDAQSCSDDITESDRTLAKQRQHCPDVGHDWGNGHGVSAPLRPGETQRCKGCGMYRSLSERGRISYADAKGRANRRPPRKT
jgi:hypothetical protein